MITKIKDRLRVCRTFCLRRVIDGAAVPHVMPGRRVTVIAPHPDDETFGCGGMLAARVERGDSVQIVFLTRGEASLTRYDVSSELVATMRVKHATAAARELGIGPDNLVWLGLPDSQLPRAATEPFAEAVASLASTVAAHAPDVVYAPHLNDGWGDHSAAAELAMAVVAQSAQPPALFFYAVWIWHNVRFADRQKLVRFAPQKLDIRLQSTKKTNAIDCYFTETLDVESVPYCGNLPYRFVDNFRRPFEYYFAVPTNRVKALVSQDRRS